MKKTGSEQVFSLARLSSQGFLARPPAARRPRRLSEHLLDPVLESLAPDRPSALRVVADVLKVGGIDVGDEQRAVGSLSRRRRGAESQVLLAAR